MDTFYRIDFNLTSGQDCGFAEKIIKTYIENKDIVIYVDLVTVDDNIKFILYIDKNNFKDVLKDFQALEYFEIEETDIIDNIDNLKIQTQEILVDVETLKAHYTGIEKIYNRYIS